MTTATAIDIDTNTPTQDDQELADRVSLAAWATNMRYGRKAFICGVLGHPLLAPYVARYGQPAVCQWLVKLNRLGLIDLCRADLVSVMDPEWVAASEIQYLTAAFHFVVCYQGGREVLMRHYRETEQALAGDCRGPVRLALLAKRQRLLGELA